MTANNKGEKHEKVNKANICVVFDRKTEQAFKIYQYSDQPVITVIYEVKLKYAIILTNNGVILLMVVQVSNPIKEKSYFSKATIPWHINSRIGN